ncbi:hypothetical protein Rt10032_c02g1210 [Rhodotorula toruloides]|uniref:Uncharacterized protein n=1 Tax=Rhodotorula toruloides TaxID=5286 RepID=A0A511K9Y8_RHOTO|nr:hypothetical protein Rt10032_c02g1210 [Rhodotorula toruloides]
MEHNDEDIFTAFTHLGPDSEPHEVQEEEDVMPTLNSPVHPLLIAQTPGEFIRHNFPDIIHRYIRLWHTVLCGKDELDFTHWFEPEVQLLGRGSGRTAHDPLCCKASPTTTPLYLIDNNYVHDAGARIWVDKPATAVVLGTTAVSGPFPELKWSGTHEQTYVRAYEDWKNGRYGGGHAWTVDSASKRLSDSKSVALKGHFYRVIWQMVGPAESTPNGIVKHDPSVLVEHGDRWWPSITIHVLTLYHGYNLNAPIHFAIKFLSPHEPTRRSFTIAPHMLLRPL